MNDEAHAKLSSVLDKEDADLDDLLDDNGEADLKALLQREHEARIKAESQSQDRAQRLAVHHEQVSEYAQQKANELSELRRQATALQDLLNGGVSTVSDEFKDGFKRLFAFLDDALEDVTAFATQAQDDTKRLKASASQADQLMSVNGAVPDDAAMAALSEEGMDEDSPTDVTPAPGPEPDLEDPEVLEDGEGVADPLAAPNGALVSLPIGEDDELDDAGGPSRPAPDAGDEAGDEPGSLLGTGDLQSGQLIVRPTAPVASVTVPPPPPPPGTGGAPMTAATSTTDVSKFTERAKFIPMRLSLDDRRLFKLLEAALTVSDYTDKVDVYMYMTRKDKQIVAQVKDVCSILLGLQVAQDYRRGQELVQNRDFARNAMFFQKVFEIGRRYKIMNPDRMRSTYGKLMYMLMDTAKPEIKELLEFQCIRPLTTVYSFLKERGAQELLTDPRMAMATMEIDGSKPRHEVQRELAKKEHARKRLAAHHCNRECTADEVLDAIYSFSDNNTYLRFNRDPVDKMIGLLKHYFQPNKFEEGYSLAISSGRNGARLSHNHERQYSYVLQSLSLWSEISTDMFRLWYLAEQDLLTESNGYRLRDTGQGLNRVQNAPRIAKAMAGVLNRCQQQVRSWVGSSVVHLGDSNVPNAFLFIDKYTQVPRILNPIVQVLDDIPKMAEKDGELKEYVERVYGSVDGCCKQICLDFFRHAFDGSGADNFFDAGSCIDGRLTSAWNWCANLEKKKYYTVFKMTGFTGFDGDFK